PITPAPTIPTRRAAPGPTAGTVPPSDMDLIKPAGHEVSETAPLPGEIVAGILDLRVADGLARPPDEPPGLRYRDPPVRRAVHDQQRPGRDGSDRGERVQPGGRLIPLAAEFVRRDREEPGKFALDLRRAEVQCADVHRGGARGHGPQPRVMGRGQDGGPAAMSEPDHR